MKRRKIFLVALALTLAIGAEAQNVKRSNLPLLSSHRGASRLAPENTKAAFLKAIKSGADYLEIDVRTTLDGEQVIVHDKSLKRTTGLDALVSKTNLATIRTLSAGRWFGGEFTEEKVPTLEDVCILLNVENKRSEHKANLYVDCKAIDAAKVVQLLKKYELIESAVFYGDIETLTVLKSLYNEARLMPAFPGVKDAADVIKKIDPFAFDVSFASLDKETVAFIHSKGIMVFSDLLDKDDNPQAYRKSVGLNIDLIQTDDVSAVLALYQELEASKK